MFKEEKGSLEMIDYEKLKKADELVASSEIYYFSAEFGVQTSCFKIYDSEVIVFVTHCIDDLIFKLLELVHHEPNEEQVPENELFLGYISALQSEVNDLKWRMNEVCNTLALKERDNGWSRNPVFSKGDLGFNAQSTQPQVDVDGCQHECSEALLSFPPWYKCLKCGDFYR